ncbi:hypothetical protein ABIA32_005133 [Streptacidiphilus sp. MAP12-20]|uniref:hypothetical protein n=1 Tax=Streptacidiphilus sp. MAP12-20 TaxID=3156299 RepID=UPI003518CF7F
MRSRHVRAGGTLAATLGAMMLLLAGILPQAAPAQAAAPAEAATPSGGGAVTVAGPPVWQPAKGTYGARGKVTVSPAVNLTDQVVHVSWTGFTPTTDGSPTPVTVDLVQSPHVFYGVRVYECRGADPKITDCYGSSLYGADSSKGFQQPIPVPGSTTPEFPSNAVLAATHPDGSGQADLEVWTAHESQSLGCDVSHACSLVVEPNYGGDPLGYQNVLGIGKPGCENHTWDTDTSYAATAADVIISTNDVNNGNYDGEQCAWTHHVVVPLKFAPTPSDCHARAADFTVRGLEMANRMVQLWRSGFCLGTGPLSVQYTSSGGEPQARQAFLHGTGADMALTDYPDTASAPRPYVYAPLATSGIVVAFRADDRITGAPIPAMKLNARLLAKQLTQSYVGQQDPNAYDSTKGNPPCLYKDPEFLQLNPEGPHGPHWPDCGNANGGGALPVVVGGTTDLVQQLTSWIVADRDAASFLAGTRDPWGMHLDTYYEKPAFAGYPVNVFIPQDSSGVGAGGITHMKSYEWNPLLGGLVQVGRAILASQPSDYVWLPDANGNHPKASPEPVGQRTMMAIMDAGQASAFSLPQAKLLNPAGAYVGPGNASFGAAVADMATDPTTATAMLPYASPSSTNFGADKAAYPLATVQYAMLPTHGLSSAKAAKIADFLTRAADPSGGQQPGFEPGRLAAGFVPLTGAQRTQLTIATCDVQRQDGQKPGNQSPASPCTPAPPSTTGGTTGSGGTTSGGTTAGTSGGTTGGAVSAGTTAGAGGKVKRQALGSTQPVAVGSPDPNRVGDQRLLLPILLIAGGVLLVGGPATLVLTGTGAGAQLRRGSRRAWAQARGWTRSAVSRRG